MNFETALTPAFSRPTGEGESSPVGRQIWRDLQVRETRFAVPLSHPLRRRDSAASRIGEGSAVRVRANESIL